MPTPPPGYLSHFARMCHALELRREGKSYREIADRCGLETEGRAQALISRAIKRVLRETAEEVRSVELSRLEVLIQCLWERGLKDAETGDFARFDRLKQLVEAKLKWCGAQPVMEDLGKDSRVTINIVSYTKNQTVNGTAPVKDSRLTLVNSPSLPERIEDHEHSNT